MLPQANARLHAITNPGASEDYDYAGGSDTPVWDGVVDAYYTDTARLVPGNGRLDRVSADYIICDALPLMPVVGQYVTYTYEGDTKLRKILEVAVRTALPGISRTVKLYLESE